MSFVASFMLPVIGQASERERECLDNCRGNGSPPASYQVTFYEYGKNHTDKAIVMKGTTVPAHSTVKILSDAQYNIPSGLTPENAHRVTIAHNIPICGSTVGHISVDLYTKTRFLSGGFIKTPSGTIGHIGNCEVTLAHVFHNFHSWSPKVIIHYNP